MNNSSNNNTCAYTCTSVVAYFIELVPVLFYRQLDIVIETRNYILRQLWLSCSTYKPDKEGGGGGGGGKGGGGGGNEIAAGVIIY